MTAEYEHVIKLDLFSIAKCYCNVTIDTEWGLIVDVILIVYFAIA